MKKSTLKKLLKFQQDEITSHFLYKKIAKGLKGENKEVFEKISMDELKHYNIFKEYTQKDLKPEKNKILFYNFLFRIFGLVFIIKYLEKGEIKAQNEYLTEEKEIRELNQIIKDENLHEEQLFSMIKEEKLNYISSMILGLNDALVELTGALAGFTFALQNSKIIGAAGFITGIAASFSMATSEYLSQKHGEEGKNPLKAAFYTGFMYLMVVIFLVSPYFIFPLYYTAFMISIFIVFIIILIFTFFVSVVQNKNFKNVFSEMFLLCLAVVIISFLIGIFARKFLNIEI